MTWLGADLYSAGLEAEATRLAAATTEVAPATVVPTCPDWTVRDLVTHVGTGHRWATTIVTQRWLSPPPYEIVPAPDDQGAWPDWLIAGARAVATAVQECGPEEPVWTWRPEEQEARFWLRKLFHDLLVHRFDAELAAGRLGEVEPELAADGVSDLLTTIATLSRADSGDPVFADLAGTGQALRLEATDLPSAWFIERTTAGVAWRQENSAADVTVHAPARELLLVLNRRLPPDTVTILGDGSIFEHWLEHSRF